MADTRNDSPISQPAPPRIVAVVVTYNRRDLLARTLAALTPDLGGALAGLVVVDNASTDGTADDLAAQSADGLHILRLSENTGGAGGFAAGLQAAQSLFDPDWYLLLDDDARPEAGAIAGFGSLDLQDADAVAAAVYLPDGTICEMNRPSQNPFATWPAFLRTARKGRAGFHLENSVYSGPICDIDAASFVGFFLSRAGFSRAGLPDENLFIYSDDVIYSLRLRALGGRILFAPEIRFVHYCETEQSRRFTPTWKLYYFLRNQLIMYRMAAGLWFWPLLPILLIRQILSLRHRQQGPRPPRLILAAMLDGILNRRNRSHENLRSLAE